MLKNIILATILAFSANCCYGEDLEEIKIQNKNIVLSGDSLKNGYYHNLVLEMERENMVPDRVVMNVVGGYWPRLRKVCLRKGEEQLFFEARQGDSKATTEYRIFALAKGVRELPPKKEPEQKDNKKQDEKQVQGDKQEKPVASAAKTAPGKTKKAEGKTKAVKPAESKPPVKPVERDILRPIFDNIESQGLIKSVSLAEKKLTVCLLDGTEQTIPLADKIWNKIENSYNRGYAPNYYGLVSLVPYDGDQDGVDELYVVQRMELNDTELGCVAARLTLQDDNSLKMSDYVLQLPSLSDGKINEGVENALYQIYSEKIYLPQCQGAYPRFYSKNRTVADKIEKALQEEYAEDLQQLFQKNAAMGFEVVLSYEKILSIRFIGGDPRRNHFVHFDPRNGKPLTLGSMFITNSGFLKRMTELSPNKHKYRSKDLHNWYMKDTSLVIILEEDGKQKAEQFKLGAFEEFLNPRNEILHVDEKKEK